MRAVSPSAPALPLVRLRSDELYPGPWVYARQVEDPDPERPPASGDLVEVSDASGRFVGHALYNDRSDVRLRWLSRGRRGALARPRDFLLARLRAADRLRRRTLALERVTDAYRVAHAEGDDLPGLVVDRLGRTLVCEHHALGFWRLRAEVEQALGELYPGLAVVHRVPRSARRAEGMEELLAEEADLPGAPEEWIREHDLSYPVRPGLGHKTGWFCDQRDNRVAIGALARGRSVLDLCCNAGGFALACARGGAREVHAVDLDEVALELARRAAERNALPVRFEHADAFDVLRAQGERSGPRPELVVLDPPKLIPGRARMDEGLRKYRDLNALALGAVAPDGLLATFSCSGALDLAAFLGLVFGAARRARREVRLLQVLQAAPDHPQRPDWPRSRYLKGCLLAVDRDA